MLSKFSNSFEKLKLHDFNNLTKTLRISLYEISPLNSNSENFLKKINEKFNGSSLADLLFKISKSIDSHVLNYNHQDYQPLGASSTMLIAEEKIDNTNIYQEKFSTSFNEPISEQAPNSHLFHLDKSHLSCHSYPERCPVSDFATFRLDIDVSTCGLISPLKSLKTILSTFDCHAFILDYIIRGFTRDTSGKKLYRDCDISNLSQCFDHKFLQAYNFKDKSYPQTRFFHSYFIKKVSATFLPEQHREMTSILKQQ